MLHFVTRKGTSPIYQNFYRNSPNDADLYTLHSLTFENDDDKSLDHSSEWSYSTLAVNETYQSGRDSVLSESNSSTGNDGTWLEKIMNVYGVSNENEDNFFVTNTKEPYCCKNEGKNWGSLSPPSWEVNLPIFPSICFDSRVEVVKYVTFFEFAHDVIFSSLFWLLYIGSVNNYLYAASLQNASILDDGFQFK